MTFSVEIGVNAGTLSSSTTVNITSPLTCPIPTGMAHRVNTVDAPPMPTGCISFFALIGRRRYLFHSTASCDLNANLPITPCCAAVSAKDMPGSREIPMKTEA